MVRNNFPKFLKLRKEFPFFEYEGFEYKIEKDVLSVEFSFNLAGKHFFRPVLKLEKNDYIDFSRISSQDLETLLFHIGMVESISYWKAACPPVFIIRDYALDKDREQWWKKLFLKGLGEFFYLNGIEIDEDHLFDFRYKTNNKTGLLPAMRPGDSVMVPVGGGKDSVVTLELLKRKKNVFPFILNPRPASIDTVRKANIDIAKTITVHRTIDSELLKLNKNGFLNGHTPFSALLAFISLLAANFSGVADIALSNESSANEPTHFATGANHQYSKSFEFEKDFREYVHKHIQKGVNYFSFLRPLSEYQIAALFSMFPAHFDTFRSCNAGSKENIWCGKCSKCLFTYIILSPFVERERLNMIFGNNLLEKAELKPFFNELTGLAATKPFECVGTVNEVRHALNHHKEEKPLPLLLKDYPFFDTQPVDIHTFSDFRHFLNKEYEAILSDALKSL